MNKKILLGILLVILIISGCAKPLSHEEYIKCRQAIFKELVRPSEQPDEYQEYFEHPIRFSIKRLLYSKDEAGYVRLGREIRNRTKDAAVKACNSFGYSFRRFDISHKLYGRFNLRYSEELTLLDPRPFEIKRARRICVEYPGASEELMFNGEITLKVEKNVNMSLDGFPVTMVELPELLEGYTPSEIGEEYGEAASLPKIVLDVDTGVLCSELWSVLALLRDQGKKYVILDYLPYSCWARELRIVQPDTSRALIPKGNYLALTLTSRTGDNNRQVERIIQLLEPSEDLDIYEGSRFRNWGIVWRADDVNFGELVRVMVHIDTSLAGKQYMFLLPPDEYNAFKRSGRTTQPWAIPDKYRRMVRAWEAREYVY